MRPQRRANAGGFGAAASIFPGVSTTITDKTHGTYPMPSMAYPAVNGLPAQVPASLQSKRAALQSQESLAQSMSVAFPAGKRPRTAPRPNYQPNTGGGAAPGRGTTPSFLVDATLAASRAISEWTPGHRTADFASIQRVVQANKGSLEYALYLAQQLVFNHKAGFLTDVSDGYYQPISARLSGRYLPRPGGGRRKHMGFYRLLSLPVLNYYLRLDDYYRDDGEGWITPQHVMDQYSLDGAVRTDANESEHAAYRKTNSKLYTITVDGRQPAVTNIWGAVRQQQPLYLIVKRVQSSQAPEEYVVSPADSSRQIVPVGADPDGNRPYHRNPIQVVPWADYQKWRPSLEDLRYYDEEAGGYRYGVALKVGWANYSSVASNEAMVAKAWYDARTLMNLPTADITINMTPDVG